VAEIGSHEQLLSNDGIYAGLWAAFVGDAEYAA
jgi:ABC-type multidrug transport system fused ATPase/permease subunit